MLERFSLENFKALKQVSIEPALITLLIGPNGTGKSSLLQALAVLKQSVGQSQLQLLGPHAALGSYRDVVHGSRVESEIAVGFTIHFTYPIEPIAPEGGTFDYDAKFGHDSLRWHKAHVKLADLTITAWLEKGRASSPGYPVPFNGASIVVAPQLSVAKPLVIGGSTQTGTTDADLFNQMQQALRQLCNVVSQFLVETVLVPARRGAGQPAYDLGPAPSIDLFRIEGPDQQSVEIASTLLYERDALENKVSAWSEKIVGRKIRGSAVPGRRVALEAGAAGRYRNIVNEGFGTNQLTHLLTQLATGPSGGLIGIEEPEIHLHPAAQARLCDVLVEVARDESKQLLATTHSEHILMAFLTAIAQGKLQGDELAIYYFERKNGYAEATRLPVDEKGRIEGGLRGFFEADIEQLDTYLQALKK